MIKIEYILLAFFAALIAVVWIHPRLVKIAHMKNIVDNPNARKLQQAPVPVLGGVAVFFGIVLGIVLTSGYTDCMSLMTIIAAMLIMLYTGTMDDIMGLSARLRLLLEIGVVGLLIFTNDMAIDNFHGLWGLFQIPMAVAVPVTIFAAVGIINAVNLIDGVNGLSSGFCIMASTMFGGFFYLTGNTPMLILAVVSVGSLLPFFFHNVFGKTSKMFIGDGGALVMGIVMSTFVVNTLSNSSVIPEETIPESFGLVPFTLAIMSIPVFDTLRVMTARMMRGVSPFHPDKTHLHHLFVGLGFSHAGTSMMLILFNVVIILSQSLTWYLGGSVDLQLYVVIITGAILAGGIYYGVSHSSDDSLIRRSLRAIGRATHFERKGPFLLLQKLVDRV
ncbi:MAG: undecaprenyl/decaprenyl-phosphate alpha-N-acetylglucosaminyl 1-phosphate transferase [Alistipes sp.]|nr:undecaprenyl/decaprenyl-phosphate alpha-N-acetylglucosaminyl 1-phosphate transferase [Alistipes sp.]